MSDEAERFVRVSVLFSEPKIPQLLYPQRLDLTLVVSVLFSEPKIPQLVTDFGEAVALVGFSALQRAENSSTAVSDAPSDADRVFQCSSASRKFLNCMK